MSVSINAGLVSETDKQVVHVRVGQRLASTFPTELEKDMIGCHGVIVRIGNIVQKKIDEFIRNANRTLCRRGLERDPINDLTVVADLDRSSCDIDILQPEVEYLPDAKSALVQESEKQSLPRIVAGCE